jgi:hypothetical protein
MPRNTKPMKDLIVSKPNQPNQQQTQQQTQLQNQKPTLVSSVIEGMAFGGGSGLAHAFIGRLFSSSNQSKADDKKVQYAHCLEITKNNYEACEHLQM